MSMDATHPQSRVTPKALHEVTVEDLKKWALKQDRTRSNPRDLIGTCMYNGPDNTHCIAGQFFVDHGFVVPDEHNEGNGVFDIDLACRLNLDADLENCLDDLQTHADIATIEFWDEPWGYAIDKVFGEAS